MSPDHAALTALLPRRELLLMALATAQWVALGVIAYFLGLDARIGILTGFTFMGIPFYLGWKQRDVVSRDLLALLPGHRDHLLRWSLTRALPVSFAVSTLALAFSTHSIAFGIAVAACAQITGFALGYTGLRNPAVDVACVLPWLVISYLFTDHAPLDHQAIDSITYVAGVFSIACVVAAARVVVIRIMAARRGQDAADPLPPWNPVPHLLVGVGTTGVSVLRAAWNIGVIQARNLWSPGSAFLLILLVFITGTAPFPAEWVMKTWFIMIILPGLVPAFGVMEQNVIQVGKGHVHEGMLHLALLRRLSLARRHGSAAWFLGLLMSALLHAGWMGIAIAGGAMTRAVHTHGITPDPLALGLVAVAAAGVGTVIGSLLSTITSMWIRILVLYVVMALPDAGVLIGPLNGLELAGILALVAVVLFPLAWHRVQALETA
jgi:hypothetical protein